MASLFRVTGRPIGGNGRYANRAGDGENSHELNQLETLTTAKDRTVEARARERRSSDFRDAGIPGRHDLLLPLLADFLAYTSRIRARQKRLEDGLIM